MNRRHLRTILWLRWRLSRNQWSRGGQVNAVLTMIIVIAGFIIGALGAIGGLVAGIFGLAKVSPMVLLGIWDVIIIVFLFFWMIGLVSELQRSETIDISKMLHLPVSLKDVFLINYLASHLTVAVILFLPAMLGLSLGLLLGRSLYMILMIPLVLSFVFMITAWTYCLRGWLVTLMVNKRRRRAIIAGITFAFILISQLPNLLGNVLHDHNRHRSRTTQTTQPNQQTGTVSSDNNKLRNQRLVLIAHDCVPFLWVGNGARALAMGNPWPAVLAAAGGFVIGGLGIRRAYRSTVRFYQGQAIRAVTKKKQKKEKVIHVRKEPLTRKLPGISAQTSALASAFFRSLARAPEAKMMLATNLIFLLIFGVSILFRRSGSISNTYKPFIASAAVGVTFFGVSQLLFNMFGMDRNGFRTLVLTPLPRKKILLSKNLASLPVVLGIGLILLLVVKFAGRLTAMMFITGFLQLIAAFLLLSIVGNLVSVLVPYRIAPGSMKPTKTTTLTTVFIVLSHMSFPMVMLPVLFVPVVGWIVSGLGWLPAGPTNVLVALLLLGPLVFFYLLSLEPLGKLLLKREKKILEVVTKEIE
jgi:ABC-2 type transport system permease protein